jgi:hypothetical protein
MIDHGANFCPSCDPPVPLDVSRGQKVLNHVGAHILYDRTIDRSLEPCGLCLRPSPTCVFHLTKASNGIQVDFKKSTCTSLAKFKYKAASTSSDSSPCSNVPIRCPICLNDKHAVWRYNLHAHLKSRHPAVDCEKYRDLWDIDMTEKSLMKAQWNKRHKLHNVPKPQKKGRISFKISESHSTRLALRYPIRFSEVSIAVRLIWFPL